jgi:hypothetical protein
MHGRNDCGLATSRAIMQDQTAPEVKRYILDPLTEYLNMPLQTILATAHSKAYRALTIIFFAAMLIIGSIPGAKAGVEVYASGPTLHSVAYAVLTFLLFLGVNGDPGRRALTAVLFAACLGAIDEFVQSFFAFRHATPSDWLIDCTSSTITTIVLFFIWKRSPSLR